MDEDGSLFNNILVLDMSHYSWLRDDTAWCQMISLWNMFVTTNDEQCQFMIHTILSAYISSIITRCDLCLDYISPYYLFGWTYLYLMSDKLA